MKARHLLSLLSALLCHGGVFAQGDTTIIVKAGTSVKESIPAADLYEYPRFTYGTVVFKDGKRSGAAINYNRFLDEMQFTTANGDTLTVIDQKNMAFVKIGTDTFLYDKGYIKSVSSASNVKLGVKHILRIKDKKKLGAYGMTSSTETIDIYSSYYDGNRNYDLVVMQELVLVRKTESYIGDKNNRFVVANKKNVLKLFPKQHQELVAYFEKNEVVFTNKTDVEKLVQFLAKL